MYVCSIHVLLHVAQMGALNALGTPSLITVQCELTRLSWVKIDIYL